MRFRLPQVPKSINVYLTATKILTWTIIVTFIFWNSPLSVTKFPDLRSEKKHSSIDKTFVKALKWITKHHLKQIYQMTYFRNYINNLNDEKKENINVWTVSSSLYLFDNIQVHIEQNICSTGNVNSS